MLHCTVTRQQRADMKKCPAAGNKT